MKDSLAKSHVAGRDRVEPQREKRSLRSVREPFYGKIMKWKYPASASGLFRYLLGTPPETRMAWGSCAGSQKIAAARQDECRSCGVTTIERRGYLPPMRARKLRH
jgi:hypothetical protein